MRRVALIAVGLAVLVAGAAAWLATRPGSEPAKGIVFQAKVDGLYQLFRIDPDGSGLRQLTHVEVAGKSGIPGVEQAVWSPDAQRIVFDSDFAATPRRVNSLYTMKPDGTGLERLPIELGRFVGAPAFSPDGKLLSFDWDESNEPGHQEAIYVGALDGTGLRRLTRLDQPNALVGRTNWSPDGRWLVFAQSSGIGQSVIVRMRPDGSGRRELTLWALNANEAKWSPDGSRIAFNSHWDAHPGGVAANVFTMRPDGTGVVQLTHYAPGTMNAYVDGWSPDGTQIVVHIFPVDPDGPGPNQLYVLNADGSGMRQLTHMPAGANPGYASWSPAG